MRRVSWKFIATLIKIETTTSRSNKVHTSQAKGFTSQREALDIIFYFRNIRSSPSSDRLRRLGFNWQPSTMPSPSRDPVPSSLLHSSLQQPDIHSPPSPRTPRVIRRLQSAHTLGASNHRPPNQPSLITQQRREQQRNASPPRFEPVKPVAGIGRIINRSPQRGRANSDATPPLVQQMNTVTAAKRHGIKKPVFSHGHLTLQQIIREGPANGDFRGALESARWKVIDEGVKSAEDGMVGLSLPLPIIERPPRKIR